jgi:hypothetical protein
MHVVLPGAASKQLEAAMAGLADKQQQQQQGSPAEAVLDLFDLSMLKYKERDVLLETFQHYRCACSSNSSQHGWHCLSQFIHAAMQTLMPAVAVADSTGVAAALVPWGCRVRPCFPCFAL